MTILFVYNADSDPLSGPFDIGHKIINPETSSCALCKLTFDTFTEKRKWRSFRETSPFEMEFLHRDEFEKKYNLQYEYPVILRKKSGSGIEIMLAKKDIDTLPDPDALIEAVKKNA